MNWEQVSRSLRSLLFTGFYRPTLVSCVRTKSKRAGVVYDAALSLSSSIRSWQSVPGGPPSSVTFQQAFFYQRRESNLQCVRACPELAYHVARRDAALITHIVEDFDGEFWQRCKRIFFSLDLHGKAALLLLQCAHEKKQPGMPVRHFGSDGGLRLAQAQIIAFLAVLNNALQR